MWHHYLFSAMPGKLINGTLLHSKKGLFEYIFYLNKVLVPVCLMPWFFSTWWLYNWVAFWKWKLLVGVKGFSFICYRSVGIFTWVDIYLSTLGFWLPCMLCRCSIFFSLTNFRFYPDITNDQTLDIIMIGYITVIVSQQQEAALTVLKCLRWCLTWKEGRSSHTQTSCFVWESDFVI